MKRFVIVSLILFLFSRPVFPENDLFGWLNRLRKVKMLPELVEDRILTRTARDYAETLLAENRFSHRDSIHKTALDRYRVWGGTSTIVGEIIGTGPTLSAVEEAWERSAEHLELLLKPDWTHTGAGKAEADGRKVWVVLFTVRRVRNLRLKGNEQEGSALGYFLSGSFVSAEIKTPLLFSGIARLEPLSFQPETGAFLFFIPLEAADLYTRLGYLSQEERIIITDVFYPLRSATFFPEREPQ